MRAAVTLTLRPAPAETGIVFRRTDLGVDIPARFDAVCDTRLCTVLAAARPPEARVGTVEHVMAALSACGIDNAVIEVDGPEVPVLDGSAEPFVFLIECAGIVDQDGAGAVIEVLRRCGCEGQALTPSCGPRMPPACDCRMSIAFAAAAIGRQAYSLRARRARFRASWPAARTFALRTRSPALRAAGLARGGTLDNAVVVDGDMVLNPAGLRMPDEFVRHKMLDAVGDLALAGARIAARFIGHRSGHALNNRLLRALFADPRTGAHRPCARRAWAVAA